jgi:hypothetical protein
MGRRIGDVVSPRRPSLLTSIKRMVSEPKRETDAELLYRMFNSRLTSSAMYASGSYMTTNETKGATPIGTYTFVGVGENMGGVTFFKIQSRFGIEATAEYDAPRGIILLNNPAAKDVSLDELRTFVNKNSLVMRRYSEKSFMCGDFAGQLHNRAEASGIRCGFVMMSDLRLGSHAFNVFCCTKKGKHEVVFVDMTDKKTMIITGTTFKKRNSGSVIALQILL